MTNHVIDHISVTPICTREYLKTAYIKIKKTFTVALVNGGILSKHVKHTRYFSPTMSL